jgi:hypothetical protein
LRLVFDFLYGNLQQLLLAPGIEADQGFRAYLQQVQAGSLNLIFGSLQLTNFKQIAQMEAYFLSRYHVHTCLLTSDEQPLDLLPWLQSHCPTHLDQWLRLSPMKQYRLPARLVAFRLKQEVAEQRRRRAKPMPNAGDKRSVPGPQRSWIILSTSPMSLKRCFRPNRLPFYIGFAGKLN